MIVHYKRLGGCFLLGQKSSCSPGACSEMPVDRTLLTLRLVVIFAISPLSHDQAVDAEGHPWWKHAVFYEVYPRSYMDSNNDGVGDLNGIASKMDYLKWLGVDAIWITPCFPSPQIDFGYDVSNYVDIDPMYGTLRDFDRMEER